MSSIPVPNSVKRVVEENQSVRTIFLEKNIRGATPGQFGMVWIPGVDEKPLSFSFMGEETAVTVQRKGKFTEAFFKLKRGDYIGVRGPCGKGFNASMGQKPCAIAGGLGVAPIAPLAEKIANKQPIIIIGATSKDKLIFTERMEKVGHVMYTTDDDSFGKGGFATDALSEVIKRVDFVFGCGPEPMLKKVFELCQKNNVACQLSLERYMRCGFGVCGSCTAGKFRVCTEGPVFSSEQLAEIEEFGKSARLKCGREVSLHEYYSWRE